MDSGCDTASRMRRLSQLAFRDSSREKPLWRSPLPLLDRGQSVRENGHRNRRENRVGLRGCSDRLFALTIAPRRGHRERAVVAVRRQSAAHRQLRRHRAAAGATCWPTSSTIRSFRSSSKATPANCSIHYAVAAARRRRRVHVLQRAVFIGPVSRHRLLGRSTSPLGERPARREVGCARTDWQPVPPKSDGWEPSDAAGAGERLRLRSRGRRNAAADRPEQRRASSSASIRSQPSTTLMFMSGPPAVDAAGNILYGAFRLQSRRAVD